MEGAWGKGSGYGSSEDMVGEKTFLATTSASDCTGGLGFRGLRFRRLMGTTV